MMVLPWGSSTFLLVGSKVANSLSAERTEDPDAKRMVGGCGFSDDAAAGSSQAGDVLQGRGVD